MAEEPMISYSARELFSRLDGKVDMILSVLTNKADRSDVAELERRQDATEGKVTGLETRETEREKHRESYRLSKQWAIAIIASVSTSLTGVVVEIILAARHQ